ncbi:tetratricopeptide repeat protein [Lujinxingia vulgaris]|nr:tetratricopeptide repeat protein [Lujinxingia vulgaris]
MHPNLQKSLRLFAACLTLLLTACAGAPTTTTEPAAPLEFPHDAPIDAAAELNDILTFLYDTHGSDLEAVRTRLKALVERAPAYPLAHYNLGLLAHISNEPDRARDHYTRALELDPKLSAAHINLGILAADARNDGQAQRHFETALQLSPDHPLAHQNISTRSSSPDDTYTEPTAVEVHLKAGLEQWAREDRDAALSSFRQALETYETLDEDQQHLHREPAAHAAFMLAEDANERAMALKMDATEPERLRNQAEAKVQALNEAHDLYKAVILYESPQWAVAATYRIGEGYLGFVTMFRQSPVPEELREDQKLVYKGILEDKTTQLLEHTYNHFTTALQIAQDTGILTDFSYRAALARFEIKPDIHSQPAALPPVGQPRQDGFVLHGFLSPPSSGDEEPEELEVVEGDKKDEEELD